MVGCHQLGTRYEGTEAGTTREMWGRDECMADTPESGSQANDRPVSVRQRAVKAGPANRPCKQARQRVLRG